MTRVPTIASVTLLRALSKSLALAAILLSGSALSHGQDKPSAVISTSIDVRPEDLLAQPPAANWVSYNGDYTGRRFSTLAEITAENVGNLRTQWIFHLRDSTGLEVTPVAVDGILFVTSANDAFALDARTGRAIWHYSRPVTEGLIDDASQHHNRGIAIWHSKVFLETDNAHLVCLDARSGHLLWDVAYAVGNKNYGATSAPLVVKDKVIVGTSGGDDGVRGFVAAFDAETGKEAWRLWTIPGPGEFGSDSWPGDLYLRGGGTTWMPGTYDPDLNTIYWGTSNAAPDFDGGPRPGDDLYTACVLAIDPDTGKMKWYFQFTPTIFTTMTLPKLPCLSMPFIKASLENCCSRRIVTDFFTSSIAPTESSSPPFPLSPSLTGPKASTRRVVPFAPAWSRPTKARRFAQA